jgi:hypothetical protein
METEGSVPCSQEADTNHTLSQVNSTPTLTPYFFKIHFNIILLSVLGLPSSLFSSNAVYISHSSHVCWVIAQSVYRWATGWTIGVLGFDSPRRLGIFLFPSASRTALGPTQPPIQWVPGALSLRVKWPGREADHSPPSNAEVKNAWSYTSTPQCVFMA